MNVVIRATDDSKFLKPFLVLYQALKVLLKDSIKLLFKSSEKAEYLWWTELG